MSQGVNKYTRDVYSLVCRKDELSQILFDIGNFSDKIGYRSVIQSSGEDIQKRRAHIFLALKEVESEILQWYFGYLLDREDLWLFEPTHFKSFCEELNTLAKKAIVVTLTTAVKLEREDLKMISEQLSERMGGKVVFEVVIDQTVLGGVVIKKDNYILDFSLKTKLNNLAAEWKKSVQE